MGLTTVPEWAKRHYRGRRGTVREGLPLPESVPGLRPVRIV
jgi:hypothetical protein